MKQLGWLALFFSLVVPQVALAQATPAPKGSVTTPESAAPAADPKTLAEARRRFDQGTELFKDGDFKLALVEFEKAYELVPSYQVLFSIGQVSFQLNNYARALNALTQYLAEGGSAIPADRRASVENDIKQLKTRIAYLSVTTNTPDVEISIDDRVLGKTPLTDVIVDGGPHRVTAVKQGFNAAFKQITLAGGEHGSISIDLVELATRADRHTEAPKTNYAPIAYVATGAFAIGTIVTGWVALNEERTLRDVRASPAATDDVAGVRKRAEIEDQKSDTVTMATVATVFAGATVVSAALSVYFTLKNRKAHTAPVEVGVGPTSIQLAGTF